MRKARRLLWLDRKGGPYPFHLLNSKAQLLATSGDWHAAYALFREMLSAVEGAGEEQLAATVKNQLGFMLTRTGKNQEALRLLEEAYRYDLETGDTEQSCRPLVNMGNAYKNIGDYKNARDCYLKAIEVAGGCGDRTTLAMVHSNMALLQWQQGENEQAMDSLKLSLAEAEAAGDLPQKGIVQSTMGNVLYSTGKYDQALECFRGLLAIARTIGDKYSLRVALNNLGAIHDVRGEYGPEMECFRQSLDLAREMGNRGGERLVLGNLGSVCMSSGDLEQADAFFRASLVIAEELGERRGIGIALGNLGMLAALGGDHQGALELYERAIPILEELRARDYLSNCLHRRADASFRLGRHLEAAEWAAQALEAASQAGLDEEAGLARVLAAEVDHRLGRMTATEAHERLKRIRQESREKVVQAEAASALYRLTGSPEYKEQARALLSELISQVPRHEYRLKLEKLD